MLRCFSERWDTQTEMFKEWNEFADIQSQTPVEF